MTDERLEHEDEVLARYRKLPKPEPPAALDAAILAQARAAVAGAAGTRVERRSRSRWPALFATAATLALAVGVSWQMRQAEQARNLVVEGVAVPKVAEEKQVAAEEPLIVSGSRAKRDEDATFATDAGPVAESAQSAAEMKTESRRAAIPEAAPAPDPAIVLDEPLPMAEPAPPAAPPAPPPAPAQIRSAPAAPASAAPRPFSDAERDESLTRKQSAPAAGAASNASGATSARSGEVDAAAERALDRIEKLIARKRFDAARRALARFRREHPDYEIPRAITDALDRE